MSPENALQTFQLPSGWLIELIAAEPLVVDPVAIAWDEHGRMYVAEMRDYPNSIDSARRGRVRLLTDTDGDGRMDRSDLFAENLPFVNGVLPHRGGVLVTLAPDILYLKDTDGDGKADVRQVVVTGFTQGIQQLLVNGLHWGLDNWIYGANGRSNGSLHWPDASSKSAMPLVNTDFRFRPGSPQDRGLEAASGFSQFGLTFDEWGNRFISWNTIHIRHVVIERNYLQRNPNFILGNPTAHVADADHGDAGRVYPISPAQENFHGEPGGYFNATSGIEIDRGGIFPPPYAGSAFVGEPLRNIVHRDELVAEGATFIARRGKLEQDKEFLASTDTWFRPVNMATGPDGALYIVDYYREQIEHPEFIPEAYRKKIDFYNGSDRGRIYRVRPRDAKLHPVRDISHASGSELVELLSHPNGWYRETAKRLLMERGNSSTVAIQLQATLNEAKSPHARLFALTTLDGLGALSTSHVEKALADKHPRLREHAVRLVEALPKAGPLVQQLSKSAPIDLDPRVRFQAALTLGSIGGDAEALERIARQDLNDQWTRAAVLTAIGGSSDTFLRQWLAGAGDAMPTAGEIELLFGAGATAAALTSEEVKQRPDLSTALSNTTYGPTGFRGLALLAGLGDGWQRVGQTVPDRMVMLGGADLVARWKTIARRATLDDEQPEHIRRSGIQVLAMQGDSKDLATLAELIDPKMPSAIQEAAMAALVRSSSTDVAALLLARWPSVTAGLRRKIVEALLTSDARVETLLSAIESGRPAANELETGPRYSLTHWPNTSLRERAAKLFATGEARKAVIDRYQSVLGLRGRPQRGETLFTEKACAGCHTMRGVGGSVGPDLSAIASRTTQQLIEDILDPNRQVSPDFIGFMVSTHDGQMFMGTIAVETATQVVLRQTDGSDMTVPRARITALTSTGRSLMPEGMEATLSPQDLADLISFLKGEVCGSCDEMRVDRSSQSLLEMVSVTGTRLPQPGHSVDIDTIDKDLIRTRGSGSVTDLLRQVPGIDVAQPGGAGAAELFIRGAESNFTTALIDGVKVNNLTNDRGGSFDFTTVAVDEIERIEIVRGPLSAIYGADALSGAVNIITRGSPEKRRTSVGSEIGLHNYRRIYVNASGPIVDAVSGSLHATDWNTGEAVDGFRSELTAIQGGMRYAGKSSSGNLGVRHSSSSRSAFPAASGGPLFASSRALEHSDAEEWLISAGTDRSISKGWTAGLVGSFYDRNERIATPAILSDGFTAVPAADSESRFRFGQVVLHNGLTVADQLQLDAGIEFRRESGVRAAVFDFNGMRVPSRFNLDRSTSAAFMEGLFSTDWGGEIFASFREDDPANASSRLSKKFAVSHLHDESGIRFTVSWAEGFKLPSFFALGDSLVGNPDLKTETGDTFQLRVAMPLLERNATIEFAMYESRYQNLIDFDFAALHLVNRSEVEITGADISLALTARTDLQFDTYVGYMDVEVNPGGGALRFRPKWRGGLSAIWQPTPLWTLQANMKSVGVRLASSIPTGDVVLDAYERLDFSVSRRVGPNFTVTTAIDNVLGRDYQEDAGVPSPGRMVRIGGQVTL